MHIDIDRRHYSNQLNMLLMILLAVIAVYQVTIGLGAFRIVLERYAVVPHRLKLLFDYFLCAPFALTPRTVPKLLYYTDSYFFMRNLIYGGLFFLAGMMNLGKILYDNGIIKINDIKLDVVHYIKWPLLLLKLVNAMTIPIAVVCAWA